MPFVDTLRGKNTTSPACACSHGAEPAGIEGSAELEDMFCPQDDPFTCDGTYVIKQTDMDVGSYGSVCNVTAVSPNGSRIEDSTGHSTELTGAANISVGERDVTSN